MYYLYIDHVTILCAPVLCVGVPSLQVDDSHTVKDLIKTVAEKIGKSHMFVYVCRWIYVLTRC